MVDALGGAPGVYSSRYAGENATDEDRYNKLLDAMKDVPDEERTARFVDVVAIAEPGRVIGTAEGKVEGVIARSPSGTNGFGYDPIFFIPEFGRTMAELTDEEKDGISHRGRAFRAARKILEQHR